MVYNYITVLYTLLWFSSGLFCTARDTLKYKEWIRDDAHSKGNGTGTLVSANGMFELGFFTPEGSPGGKRYVGIWYYNVSPRTVVWVANRDNPIATSSSRTRGGLFGLRDDGNIQLFDDAVGYGTSFWSSKLENSPSVSKRTVTLLDSGNLVLKEYDGRWLWESFKNPTDTFLPGMKMDENLTLTAWKDQHDPYSGNFRFKLDEENEQFVILNKTVVYWKGEVSGKFLSSNKMPGLITNFLSNVNELKQNFTKNSTKPVLVPVVTDSYKRLAINSSGKIEFQRWDEIWMMGWSAPIDRCSVFNICGDFGICSNDEKSPCKCLPGSKPSKLDKWESGDFSDGCTRGTPLCSGENDTFRGLNMVKVGNPDSTARLPVNNETECMRECLDKCKCQAYSYEAASGKNSETRGDYRPPTSWCWTWLQDPIDLEEENNNTNDGRPNFYFRVALSDLNGDIDKSSRTRVSLFLIVLLTAISVIALSCICVVISFVIWKRKKAKRLDSRKSSDQRNRGLHMLDTERNIQELIDSLEFNEGDERGIDLPFFTLDSILVATNNFSDDNKLGKGGYGPVYKGKFPGGHELAIKRLSSVSRQGLQEFKNEVILIAKLQHRNLVRLRGCCVDKEEKILLYEYMPNKSLDSFIFDDTKRVLLDWETRFDIIMGIARGLLYLHQDSRLRIIHRDLKTSNILLDHSMNPKISDFGLARMIGGKQTEDNTSRIAGTYGYMSPEYALEGAFSIKSDVFSFGVVLLEIVSGKRITQFVHADPPLSLLGYAWKLWTENKVLELMDQTLKESCKVDQLIKCVNIGLLCVQEEPSDRPNMSNIVTMLDSDSTTPQSVKQPAFVLRRGSSNTASSSKPETCTDISYNMEEGR